MPATPVVLKTTYYVRDAQGNPLAIYDVSGSVITLKEQQLYGSSRLGTWSPNLNLTAGTTTSTDLAYNIMGQKYYELTNHLGNVMATISDKRLQTGSTPYYLPDVVTQQDYYSFGAPQPGDRTNVYLNHNAYRYGFNGKENDDDVGKGTGNQQDYGMRIYDPRVGRFFSVDPIAQHFPWNTPYSFAENKVIEGIDFDGLEVMIVTQKSDPVIYKVGIQNTSKDEINVYAHGTQRGLGNNDGLWFHNEAEFDKYMTKVSDQWRNRKNDGSTVLVLHSCRTGRAIVNDKGEVRGLSIGQKISKQFNITVIAPDERDNVSKDGEIGPLVDEDEDINGNHPDGGHHKSTNIQGNWNVFKDGKLIESYRGGWTPKAKATWWDRLIYGRDIKKIPQPEVKVPDTPSSDVKDNGKGSDKKD